MGKYKTKFPMARIKKIMQRDDEIGKLAAPVPVVVSKALELFLEELVKLSCQEIPAALRSLEDKDGDYDGSMDSIKGGAVRRAVCTPSHIKASVLKNPKFAFLDTLVKGVKDLTEEDITKLTSPAMAPKTRKPREQRSKRASATHEEDTSASEITSPKRQKLPTIKLLVNAAGPTAPLDLSRSSSEGTLLPPIKTATDQLPHVVNQKSHVITLPKIQSAIEESIKKDTMKPASTAPSPVNVAPVLQPQISSVPPSAQPQLEEDDDYDA